MDIYRKKCMSGLKRVHRKHVLRHNNVKNIHNTATDKICCNRTDRQKIKLHGKYVKVLAKNMHVVRVLVLSFSVACAICLFYFWSSCYEYIGKYNANELKKSHSGIYYDQLEEALAASYYFRFFYTLLVCNSMFRLINIFTIYPQTGQFILAIKKVLFSPVVIYFLLFVVCVGGFFSLVFNAFFGDVVQGLDSLPPTFINLMLYGLTQNQDDIIMAPTTESTLGDPVGIIMTLLFILFFSIILLNIFLAIVTQLWQEFMEEDLWGMCVDDILRDHVIERHTFPPSGKILTCSRRKRKNEGGICCYT